MRGAKCPECGRKLLDEAQYCRHCGRPRFAAGTGGPLQQVYCGACHRLIEIHDESRECPECFSQLDEVGTIEPNPRRFKAGPALSDETLREFKDASGFGGPRVTKGVAIGLIVTGVIVLFSILAAVGKRSEHALYSDRQTALMQCLYQCRKDAGCRETHYPEWTNCYLPADCGDGCLRKIQNRFDGGPPRITAKDDWLEACGDRCETQHPEALRSVSESDALQGCLRLYNRDADAKFGP